MNKIIRYILFIGFLSLNLAWANEPIYLKYADSLVGSNSPDSPFREFSGNVQFQQGNVNVKCNFARQFINENRLELTGNVIITQKTLTMKAPKVNYDGNSYLANAFGGVTIVDKETNLYADEGDYSTKELIANFRRNVIIEDDSATIFSNFISHNRNNRNSFAYGDVVILGKFTNAIMKSDTLIHYPKMQTTIAYGKPVLFQIDTIKSTYIDSSWGDNRPMPKIDFDTLTVACDSMIAYRFFLDEHYVFNKNVEIVRDKISSKCDSAVYFQDKEYIKLNKKPIVWYENTELMADSILILLPKKKLQEIQAYINAITISQIDTLEKDRFNQLAGAEIRIIFQSDSIKSISSKGDSKSIYFMKGDDGNNGLDRRTTDVIVFNFVDGEIDNINAIGKTFAEYFPEHIIYDKVSSFNLPLFKWFIDKPVKQFFELKKSQKK